MADYPTDEELDKIEKWDAKDSKGLLDFVHSIWQYADVGSWKEKGKTYRITTAGWSGNEDIIRAMRVNNIFWIICWHLSARGGLYVFKLP